jgi:aquaporin Z
MTLAEAVPFWVAQFVGGIVGALILWGIFSSSPHYNRSVTGLGTDGYGSKSLLHINLAGALGTEVVLTFIFVLVVLAATSRLGSPGLAGLAIGVALTAVHLIGIALTGTSVNPARSLGPALIVGGTALSQVWVFIVAPLVGGALAALAYRYLVPDEVEDADEAPEVVADREVGRTSATPPEQ